jgi:hypothetical protein
MIPMSDYRSRRSRPDQPAATQTALEALLAGNAGDPLRRALWLDTLDRRLHPLLPPSLAAHMRLANVNGAKLVFLVDSPIWHARVRLAATELLDAARSIGLEVTQVVVKTTSQPLPPKPQAPLEVIPMSAAARDALQAALASLADPEDGPDLGEP